MKRKGDGQAKVHGRMKGNRVIQETETTQRPARMVGSINSALRSTLALEQDVHVRSPKFHKGLEGESK